MPELLAHLDGRLDLAQALARALERTRQYAKRQVTWLRHQLPELEPLPGSAMTRACPARRRCAAWLTDAAFAA